MVQKNNCKLSTYCHPECILGQIIVSTSEHLLFICISTYVSIQVNERLAIHVAWLLLAQASSDLSVVDFDIPYSIAFALTGAIEVVMTIIIMATVTWQVLIVAVPVILATRYIQVKSHIFLLFNSQPLLLFVEKNKNPITHLIQLYTFFLFFSAVRGTI